VSQGKTTEKVKRGKHKVEDFPSCDSNRKLQKKIGRGISDVGRK